MTSLTRTTSTTTKACSTTTSTRSSSLRACLHCATVCCTFTTTQVTCSTMCCAYVCVSVYAYIGVRTYNSSYRRTLTNKQLTRGRPIQCAVLAICVVHKLYMCGNLVSARVLQQYSKDNSTSHNVQRVDTQACVCTKQSCDCTSQV